jgi:2-polyprenyl-3-methyl-5-hydroxy-6-metoxy-1,4-benzoquinol methylase
MTDALHDHRLEAAQASLGTSPDVIKDHVIGLIRQHGLGGRVLDFGAGRGALARRLLTTEGITSVSAVDIMDRPDDLPPEVTWYTQDLNDDLITDELFDVVVSTEVIEHLENPRAMLRGIARLLRPGGTLVLTTPNQESLRAYVGLLFGGHFVHFLGASYPAHITALLRLDLGRICLETGFEPPVFSHTGEGGIPKLPTVKWQTVSFGLLRGRLFSDNLGMVARKRSDTPGAGLRGAPETKRTDN